VEACGACESGMGQCYSTTAASAATPAKTPWDDALMTQGLKEMETAESAAASSTLLEPKPLPPPPSEELAARLNEWDFDIFTVPYDELPTIVYSALVMHPAISDASSKLDLSKLWRYTCEIAARYHLRPFHNFRHAVDVVLASSYLVRVIQRDHAGPFEDPLNIAALLVSALVHDTNHPGVMNTYLVATKHPIAAALGEAPKAVLETHHAAVAIALLERPELDFLSNLEAAERLRFIGLVRENVLNTDVTTTMTAAKEFSERRPSFSVTQFEQEARNSKTDKDAKSPDAKQVMCLIIKAADISNPARPLAVYNRWIDGVLIEFFTQGDAEKARGLPVSMNCDRDTVTVPKSQMGFITFLVMPLFKALVAYSPTLQPVVDQLEANRQHFSGLADKGQV